MATKNNPGAFDCYANAQPDEPLFVLLARSRYSAALVNLYAMMKRLEPQPSDETVNGVYQAEYNADKITEAEQCANDMVAWRLQHRPDADDVAGVRALAEAVALLAELTGAVVTIDQESLQPPRMGNYRHRVTVRPRNAPGPNFAFVPAGRWFASVRVVPDGPLETTEAETRPYERCQHCGCKMPEGCAGLYEDEGPKCRRNHAGASA